MTLAIYFLVFISFVLVALNLLPAMPADSTNFVTSFEYIIAIVRSFDFILPFETMYICVLAITIALFSRWFLGVIKWVIGLVGGVRI